MHFSNLHLIQFRNYPELQVSFSPDINCITGPNGAGKTNILDALHFLSFTKGFRSSQDQQAVQEGGDFFLDQGQWEDERGTYQVSCNYVKQKGKKILINQKPIKRVSEHIGRIPLVAVLPDDTELINGPSQSRRRFMDMLISQYDAAYLQHLMQYDKMIAQRNALLKHFQEVRAFDLDQLALWDEQLIPHGMAILEGRQEFVDRFLEVFAGYVSKIVSDKEVPHIRYRTQLEENTHEAWLALWDRQREKDRVNGYTTAGVHRDDLVFQLDGQSVRNFGSQGQQKTFVLALKLGQYKLLESRSKKSPILLLDDIFDKLDEHRLSKIAEILDEDIRGQIFITDTSQNRLRGVFDDEKKRQVRFFEVVDNQLLALEIE
ncbi:DNA replication/repair protein RecF [Pontibacter sp. G13]|uniref:DNA replication/repair protein RecF n=1 Tax=Pontibacter sp. G13 TaxID=3074898 RepID=UPI00288C267E|nr:DNA replication/repair protein RecF [Pontibacter sp. G13]WNJ16303.1 DNA replication/repair protein RecF [Pontibacter sp. G13]